MMQISDPAALSLGSDPREEEEGGSGSRQQLPAAAAAEKKKKPVRNCFTSIYVDVITAVISRSS